MVLIDMTVIAIWFFRLNLPSSMCVFCLQIKYKKLDLARYWELYANVSHSINTRFKMPLKCISLNSSN